MQNIGLAVKMSVIAKISFAEIFAEKECPNTFQKRFKQKSCFLLFVIIS
jgi:hypothetical protein